MAATLKSKVQGKFEVDDDVSSEAWDDDRGVHPEQRADGAGPALGRPEEVLELGLLVGDVVAFGGFDLDLAAQGEGVDGLCCGEVGNVELYPDERRGRVRNSFG